MEGGGGYSIRYVPFAEAQIELALIWWQRQRALAPGLLAGEIEEALDLLTHVPLLGPRARLRGHPTARRLLLRRTGYHLYYVVHEALRELVIVYFRHARRRPHRVH